MMEREEKYDNETSSKEDKVSSCPDAETLSAYFDGGRDFDEATLEHISSCAKCAKFLSSLAMIGEAVSKSADKACTDEIGERILEGTHKALEQDERLSCMKRKAWTIRAVIFLVLFVIFIFLAVRDASFRRAEKAAEAGSKIVTIHSSPDDTAISPAVRNEAERK